MDTSNVYNRKILLLSGLVGLLALVYIGTLIFDPERINSRDASWVWLDAKLADQADRIELSGTEGELILLRKNKSWVVSRDTTEYPAKRLRVEDFLRVLSTRGSYPVRGSSAASHERLGLNLDKASRIVIRGGASAYPLLDLLVGDGDATGQELYLRKNGEDEVRSGTNTLSGYVHSRPAAWFNLRLFPEEENPGLKVEVVQRVTVYAPPQALSEELDAAVNLPLQRQGTPLTLTRNEGGWTITGGSVTATTIDNQKVESYIRSILEAEGEDFLSREDLFSNQEVSGEADNPVIVNDPMVLNPPLSTERDSENIEPTFNEGQIILELGNGKTLTIKIGHTLESNRRSALVLGSPFIYVLPEWTLGRLFRDSSYFEQP